MEFTKEDIISKKFKTGLTGYNTLEVEVYLEQIGSCLEDLQKENAELKNRILEMEGDFEGLAKEKKEFAEEQLKAKNDIERMKKDAAKYCDQQKREAKLNSQRSLRDSYTKAKQLTQDIDKLKKIKESFVQRYQTFIRDQLEVIKAFQKEKLPGDKKKK